MPRQPVVPQYFWDVGRALRRGRKTPGKKFAPLTLCGASTLTDFEALRGPRFEPIRTNAHAITAKLSLLFRSLIHRCDENIMAMRPYLCASQLALVCLRLARA